MTTASLVWQTPFPLGKASRLVIMVASRTAEGQHGPAGRPGAGMGSVEAMSRAGEDQTLARADAGLCWSARVRGRV